MNGYAGALDAGLTMADFRISRDSFEDNNLLSASDDINHTFRNKKTGGLSLIVAHRLCVFAPLRELIVRSWAQGTNYFPAKAQRRQVLYAIKSELHLETQIHRAGGIRERADTDQVGAGLCVTAHILERYTSRAFDSHAG